MKTALVTGAAKGIGYETARQLAKRGFRVFLTARDRQAGEAAAARLAGLAGPVEFVHLDVADAAGVGHAAAEIAHRTDALDVLVNNAGIILDGDDAIATVALPVVRKTLETNTLGPLAVAQAFLPLLQASRHPRVINVSSGGGQLSEGMGTWSPAYCLSKTALNAVTALLAAALPGIAVNAVCPGWVRTDMGGEGAPRSVEEGADTIVWLATKASPEQTGFFWRDRQVIPW